MFGFKLKKNEVLNHWISFADGFSYPPQEFYATVEKELAARKIPNMEISRVEFSEGGMLSDKRINLRMMRERLAFDTCAAPFGNIYFFSCRTVQVPVEVKFWHILVAYFLFNLVFFYLDKLLGDLFAFVALGALVLAIGQVFRNTIAMGLSDLDAVLIKTPAIGPIYERWFRKETYYREDTRLLYLKVLPDLIKELAEETTAAKGVKLVQQYQRAPVLGELYKPLPSSVTPDKA